jgi:tRNA modification GTPase
MYDIGDTIVAVSSPPLGERSIVRISGPDTIKIINQIFKPAASSVVNLLSSVTPCVIAGSIAVDADLRIDSQLYLFFAPHSYTGDDLAEIHLWGNSAITDSHIERLLSLGARPAGPGEFTARAYLNGKIDLAQAEAVNEIIVSSNKFQLAAAERLLSGKLTETTEKIRSELMDCLARIEAGLDFSGEDIETETGDESVRRFSVIKQELEKLASDSITCESTLDLPAVGIAGAPNAGKSTLLNKLLGRERSIVSGSRKTTRDVLTGELSLKHCRCVLFDCAGLVTAPENILDELAQQAAIESLQNSSVVVFCVDVSKADWAEDISIRSLIDPEVLIPVATKCDLLPQQSLAEKTSQLKSLFGCDFMPISAKTGFGIEKLTTEIAERVIAATSGQNREGIALTTRHRNAIISAIADLEKAVDELKAGNDEVTAMLLRAAYQNIFGIEQHVDEEILDRIFSRFCIGK